MPENQDKKISYKILTSEELLKKEISTTKEIDYKKINLSAEPKIEIFGLPQKKIFLSPILQKMLFIFINIILISIIIIIIRPQEKFKLIFKEEKPTPIFIPTTTVVLLPSMKSPTSSLPTLLESTLTATTFNPSTSTSTISTKTTLTTTTTTIPTTTVTQQKTFFQSKTKTFQEIKFLKNFPSKDIIIKNLDFSSWQEEFKKFLAFQEFFETKINVNFLYNKNKIPFDFLFDYFIKPTKISSETIEEFKNNFTGSYGLLIYYGYTRKYPILIFEIEDKEKTLKFNQEWEKTTMREDLKTLFLGFEPPKTRNSFITKKQENYFYRILDFGDNFKIIWTLVDNYIIYSTTEMGLRDIFSLLK
jgi:hypothetical protein